MTGPITSAPVLVTGATGFIGAEITRQLLEAGYRVRASTRDPEAARAEGHLTSLPGADERLDLVAADMLDSDSVDRAVDGCDYVIHTASPYVISPPDPVRDLIEPAVRGAVGVVEAAQKAGSVRRIVLTSSMAAITDRADGALLDESVWNTISSPTDSPYYYSKVAAERAAWTAMADSDGLDLVVLNPSMVIGPSLVPRLNVSNEVLANLTNGSTPGVVALPFAFVDVRDVARAHLLAMTTPGAQGRYVTIADTSDMRRVIELLEENGWGDRYRLPRLSLDGRSGIALVRLFARTRPPGVRSYLSHHLGGSFRFDNSKIRRDLGIEFAPIDQTILDTMADLERWGHLGKRGSDKASPA